MSGLQVKYVELLSLSVEQAFYENDICKKYQAVPLLDTIIVPTSECISFMNKMDMVFKNTDYNGGFIIMVRVLGQNGGGDNLVRFPVKKEDKLSFWVMLRNPEMLNFDDLPTQIATDRLFYFSNQVTDAGAARNDLHTSIDPAGVSGVNDTIKKTTCDYQFHNLAPVAPNTAKVKHLLTGKTIDPESVVNVGGQADLFFDLSALPTGKCTLLISNAVTDTFYYVGNDSIAGVLGVIELSLASTLDANYRVVEPDQSLKPARPLYKVHFINRSTRWRYTFHLETNSPMYLEMAALNPADKTDFLNKLNIETNDTNIVFKPGVFTDTDLEFVSQTAVALQEKYISSTSATHDTLSLTLKKYIGDVKEASVRENLSYPDTSTIDASSLPDIYSDVFITI